MTYFPPIGENMAVIFLRQYFQTRTYCVFAK